MIRFAILTTQRTGTTFFTQCLNSHPYISCPGTVFPQVSTLKFFQVDRSDSLYRQYRSGSSKRQLDHYLQRRKSIYNCLDEVYTRGVSQELSAMGYKVSYNHAQRYPAILSWLKEHDVRIIHFVRNNLLKRFLSERTMKSRGVAHSAQHVQPIKVYVPVRRLKKDLSRRARLVEYYRRTFADNPYLEVAYESFVANREQETRRVLQFLDITEFVSLESKLVKMNPDSIERITENYDQVVQALRGTSFEKYLVM